MRGSKTKTETISGMNRARKEKDENDHVVMLFFRVSDSIRQKTIQEV